MLGQRLEDLRLADLDRSLQFLAPNSFDDPFYERLLSSLKLKQLKFKTDPTEMFDIMEDII
jgi:hypothetical protein